jgi:hypothetical protein
MGGVGPGGSSRVLLGDSTSEAAAPFVGVGVTKRACDRSSIGRVKQVSGRWSETRLSPEDEMCRLGDVAVKVAGPPRRTALEGARGCSHAAGHSIRRYRPWFTVCDALRAWLLLGA